MGYTKITINPISPKKAAAITTGVGNEKPI
jgi:hypothetical protein